MSKLKKPTSFADWKVQEGLTERQIVEALSLMGVAVSRPMIGALLRDRRKVNIKTALALRTLTGLPLSAFLSPRAAELLAMSSAA